MPESRKFCAWAAPWLPNLQVYTLLALAPQGPVSLPKENNSLSIEERQVSIRIIVTIKAKSESSIAHL